MIALTRVRTENAVPARLRAAGRARNETLLLRQARAKTFAHQSTIWKTAKVQLKADTHGKCAYCESPTDVVAHGDVEHFRPKSLYWWLTYCYDNYLFSCQICNQTYKGDHFPLSRGRTRLSAPRVTSRLSDARLASLAGSLAPDPVDPAADALRKQFIAACRSEGALLIDPYVVDPEPLFAWEADELLREVRLVPRGRSATSKRAVLASEEYLGLNRFELLRERWRVYKELRTLAAALAEPRLRARTRARIRDELESMKAAEAPYAGMVRYFMAEWGV